LIPRVPYLIRLVVTRTTLDQLVELGALDVDSDGHELVALMPDAVPPERVARVLGLPGVATSPAVGRDADSVWVLRPGPVRVGSSQTIALVDSPVFGTGLHPTTALCLEVLHEMVESQQPASVLDVGTGSGILALAALALGVAAAVAIDIDPEALRVAAANARTNGMADRLTFAHGGADAVDGAFPLVLANVLAAPLVEMAPALVRRVSHHGWLVLSGIPRSVADEVCRAYRHLGMRHHETRARGDWTAIVLQASW
jgi:ribosomal protein L11 methylase PrmA